MFVIYIYLFEIMRGKNLLIFNRKIFVVVQLQKELKPSLSHVSALEKYKYFARIGNG